MSVRSISLAQVIPDLLSV